MKKNEKEEGKDFTMWVGRLPVVVKRAPRKDTRDAAWIFVGILKAAYIQKTTIGAIADGRFSILGILFGLSSAHLDISPDAVFGVICEIGANKEKSRNPESEPEPRTRARKP